MRLLGHPVHVMLLHFPVALWPAHGVLHSFAAKLPLGSAAVVGFWVLVVGTMIGWLAAFAGLSDLIAIQKENDRSKFLHGLIHACVNGSVLCGFTFIAILEYTTYPAISHGIGFLAGESALIVAMLAGNYFGGTLIWPRAA